MPAMANAFSFDIGAPVCVSTSQPRRRMSPGWPCPIPQMYAGGCGRFRASSARDTMTATPPLDTRQQSSRCSGSATQRDAW